MATTTLAHDNAASTPLPATVMQVLAAFDRPKLEGFITVAIGLLDIIDGDSDTEADDPAGGNVEDEPHDAEEDCCLAGDDSVMAGPIIDQTNGYWLNQIGSDEDDERETWSHWMDHPPELHAGLRAGWNDQAEVSRD